MPRASISIPATHHRETVTTARDGQLRRAFASAGARLANTIATPERVDGHGATSRIPGAKQRDGATIMKEDLEHVVELSGARAASRNLAIAEAWPGITVTTHGGKVVLIGTVRSWEERRAAEHAAWALPDVREIDDRLVVAEKVAGRPARRDSARNAHRPPE
jgi:hypothetical protein